MADVVIDNSGSRADLEASVARAWKWVEGLRPAVSPRPLVTRPPASSV